MVRHQSISETESRALIMRCNGQWYNVSNITRLLRRPYATTVAAPRDSRAYRRHKSTTKSTSRQARISTNGIRTFLRENKEAMAPLANNRVFRIILTYQLSASGRTRPTAAPPGGCTAGIKHIGSTKRRHDGRAFQRRTEKFNYTSTVAVRATATQPFPMNRLH